MSKLSPVFNDQTFDASGDPAVGYQLFTYAAGSSTKLTTYTDSAGATPQTNPIILNASGYPTNGPIWLTAGQSYKFVLALSTDTDPPTSPVKTIDNVTGVNDSSTTVTQWVSSGVTPTYISTTSFTLAGDQTTEFHVGRRIQTTDSSGTDYGTITVSAYTSLTTVTVVLDSGTLDAGLSVVNLSLLRNDHPALPSVIGANVQTQTASRFTAGGTADAITGSLSPPITAYVSGLRVTTTAAANTVTAPTLNLNALGVKTIKKRSNSGSKVALTIGNYNASGPCNLEYDGTDFVLLDPQEIVSTSTIQPISASVAASALTISASALSIDFRSATIGSGTVTTVSGTPANLVISSGSTLGTVSAEQSRIAVLALNNAGTIELAAVNIAGGNDLSETGVISTTAEGGAGAADSASVIYSTTARTSVAYRIIGYIESTQATAGTWATAPSTIQGAGGNALAAMSSIGYGQAWQSVTRTFGTTYYNTTGKPIFAVTACYNATGGSQIKCTVNSVDVTGTSGGGTGPYYGLSLLIPVGASYVWSTSTGTATIITTAELR